MFAASSMTRTALIESWLRRLDVKLEGNAGRPWWVRYGDSVVAIDIVEDGNDAYARVAALITVRTKASMDLLSRVLELNNMVLMGAFRVLDNGTLAFSCTQPLRDSGFDGFQNALEYVVHVAERYSEELLALGGGEPGKTLLES